MPATSRSRTEQPIDHVDYGIDQVSDVHVAVRRARSAAQRMVVAEGGEPVVAVIPLRDLHHLLRLEDEELDPMDLEEIRQAESEPGGQDFIPFAQVKAELGL